MTDNGTPPCILALGEGFNFKLVGRCWAMRGRGREVELVTSSNPSYQKYPVNEARVEYEEEGKEKEIVPRSLEKGSRASCPDRDC
jgi:hypothetical protein